MKKKWRLLEKGIHMGTFDYTVYFICGEYEEANRYFSWKLEDNDIDHEEFDKGFEPRGRTMYRSGYCPIVWIPKKPKTPREYATLAHEMLHATCHLMEWAGVPLTQASEEVYAHAQAYLVTEALSAFKK